MRLLPSLFILFLAIPIVEIYILIEVGQVLGAPLTILAVVGTALLGAVLVRYQGMVTMAELQGQALRGEVPAQALFEGGCVLVAGALLLTPGFFTDAIGFALLTPPLRRWAYRHLAHRLVVRASMGPGGTPPDQSGPTTLEGHYRRRDSSENGPGNP